MRELFSTTVLIFLFGCHYPESRIISDNITENKDSLPQKELAELFISGPDAAFVNVSPHYSNIIFEKRKL